MAQDKPIPVIAIRDGHYGGQYRKAGAKFNVTNPRHVSDKWMAPQDSKKAKDFEKALAKRGEDRDGITGERVAAGGVPEQLAIALEENRVLQGRVAELEAMVDELRKAAPREEVQSQTPAEGHDNNDEDAVDNTGAAVEDGAPKSRRRSRKGS